MNIFRNDHWITTNEEIKNILKNCSQCWNSTLNGRLILPYNEIGSFPLQQKTQTFIINAHNEHNEEHPKKDGNNVIGHWILLSFDKTAQTAILFDPLNSLKKLHPHVSHFLETYCKNLKFQLKFLNVKTQANQSKACGFHVIWMTHKCHNLNVHGVIELSHISNTHSILNNESNIVRDVFKTFHLQ